MRYDFSKMDSDSFENMVRSLNEGIFGVKCEQYGLGPDGQREFVFEGTIRDGGGTVFQGRTIGQVKYKYITTKTDDYTWLVGEIDKELKRFREKEAEYIPDNYVFYTNVVLTPAKDTGVKDKINAYVKANNDIIKHFYVRGYDEICAILDNNRDVAKCYAGHILPGDVLMHMLETQERQEQEEAELLKRYLAREFEEELYTRMEQAGSATEKKISIDKVCIDINVLDREERKTYKFAAHVFALGNGTLGYKREEGGELERNENYILIGGPGNGKSTICQFIAQVYRGSYLKAAGYGSQVLDAFAEEIQNEYKYQIENNRIPFKIVLREYAAWINRKKDENISVIQYMKDRIKKLVGDTVSTKTMRRMLGELAWIFFFDGLDEVPESSNRQEVLRQIHIFISMELKELSCDCMVIGTTRPQGYNHDFDETRYQHLEVAELTKEDCHGYIHKLFHLMEEQTEKREGYIRIMKEALEDEVTCRLMKTPLQITIISILVKSGGKPPHERYSLFRQYYDTVVRREKQKEIVATLNDNTGWLEEMHYLIGYKLQCESEGEENPSAEISRENLEAAIGDYIEENQDNFYEAESGTAEKAEEFLMTITERICFLCENREGYYSFSIRSIQEYFAGTYLIKDKTDGEALRNIEQIAYSSYWRNTLLFTLGYIELERKSLEPEIGRLCEQMNGKDNIMKTDYSLENLCLFGSWLAIDILAEDIFRGKQQDKYVALAAKVLEVAECDKVKDFQNFSLITGAQREKLLRYIDEHYLEKGEFLEKIFKLYLTLNENHKNHLEAEVKGLAERLSEERQLMLAIYILEYGVGGSEEIYRMAKCWIEEALAQDKVKFFLPYDVLVELSDTVDAGINTILKKNLFLQWLFCDDWRLQERDVSDKLGVYMKTARSCFASLYSLSCENRIEVKIIEEVGVYVRNEEANRTELEALQTELRRMKLDYLADFCSFLLKPSFGKYQQLCNQLEREEEYIQGRYKSILEEYAGNVSFDTEKEFNVWMSARGVDYEKLIGGDIKELQCRKIGLKCTVYICGHIALDKLTENDVICLEALSVLNEGFFKMYMFVAEILISQMQQISDMSEETAQYILSIICEAIRRKYYGYWMYEMIGVLLASKYKKELWNRVPDLVYAEQMIQRKLLHRTKIIRLAKCIREKEIQDIISNIVDKIVYDEQENSYLSVIPLLIGEKVDLKSCISENRMKKLEQIEWTRDVNILTMKLLKMCVVKNDDPHKVIEEILEVNMPRKAIFMELENMLRCCVVDNKEKIWVVVYQKLENEDFEDCQKIREGIMDDMMEARCNAVTR